MSYCRVLELCKTLIKSISFNSLTYTDFYLVVMMEMLDVWILESYKNIAMNIRTRYNKNFYDHFHNFWFVFLFKGGFLLATWVYYLVDEEQEYDVIYSLHIWNISKLLLIFLISYCYYCTLYGFENVERSVIINLISAIIISGMKDFFKAINE